jgi:hypothetical protein
MFTTRRAVARMVHRQEAGACGSTELAGRRSGYGGCGADAALSGLDLGGRRGQADHPAPALRGLGDRRHQTEAFTEHRADGARQE